jgi:hypothetical protein
MDGRRNQPCVLHARPQRPTDRANITNAGGPLHRPEPQLLPNLRGYMGALCASSDRFGGSESLLGTGRSWPVGDLQKLECSIVLRCGAAAVLRPSTDIEAFTKPTFESATADGHRPRHREALTVIRPSRGNWERGVQTALRSHSNRV